MAKKLKYLFCWWCSRKLYANGKFNRILALNPKASTIVQKQTVIVHVSCQDELKKDYPNAELVKSR